MRKCKEKGCNNDYHANDLCEMHNRRMYRNGTLELKERTKHDIYTTENNHFLNELSKTKKRLNLTGEELANLIGIKIDTYRKWSQGKTLPKTKTIQDKVLKILKEAI